jgi:hypothetical protein
LVYEALRSKDAPHASPSVSLSHLRSSLILAKGEVRKKVAAFHPPSFGILVRCILEIPRFKELSMTKHPRIYYLPSLKDSKERL